MRLALRLVLTLATLPAVLAATAAATDDPRPDASTLAATTFTVTATFRGLTPGVRLDFTWTAHFEDGTLYRLGGSWGRSPGADGVLVIWTNVEDLVYYTPDEPLEFVRVCLRPPRSSPLTEITGPDGHPLCANIETGGYRAYYDEDDEYGPKKAVATAAMVADIRVAEALMTRPRPTAAIAS